MYKSYARIRDEQGVTDYRVSKETGIPRSTFTEWKNGRSKPKADKLNKIAKYLKVTIEKLIEE